MDPLIEKEISLDDDTGIVVENGALSLSKTQKDKIIEMWKEATPGNPPSIKVISKTIFGKDVDIRHPSIKLIKKFLAEQDFVTPVPVVKPKEAKEPKKEKAPEPINELTEDQHEYLRNNYKNSTVVEMCKIMFSNPRIEKRDWQVKLAAEYLETLSLNNKPEDYTKYSGSGYNVPRTLGTCVARIKQYVNKVEWDAKNLNEKQKKCVEALINFLSTLRYKTQILSYDDNEDRELFESEFVRCTYDKPDLAEEDIDQYVIYSNEVVISKNISRSIGKWQNQMDESLEDRNADDKAHNVNMTFVEAIGKMRDEYNQSIKRQGELLKTLTTKRSERISKLKSENASILTLVQAAKQEEFRDKLETISKKRKELLQEEVVRLTTIDDVKARVWGITEEDIFNG